VRMGEISEEDYRMTMQRLAQDLDQGILRVWALGDQQKRRAVSLLRTYGMSHGLRTLDALQLAVIQTGREAHIERVYCADQRLVSIFEAEGFAVVNPEEVA